MCMYMYIICDIICCLRRYMIYRRRRYLGPSDPRTPAIVSSPEPIRDDGRGLGSIGAGPGGIHTYMYMYIYVYIYIFMQTYI